MQVAVLALGGLELLAGLPQFNPGGGESLLCGLALPRDRLQMPARYLGRGGLVGQQTIEFGHALVQFVALGFQLVDAQRQLDPLGFQPRAFSSDALDIVGGALRVVLRFDHGVAGAVKGLDRFVVALLGLRRLGVQAGESISSQLYFFVQLGQAARQFRQLSPAREPTVGRSSSVGAAQRHAAVGLYHVA